MFGRWSARVAFLSSIAMARRPRPIPLLVLMLPATVAGIAWMWTRYELDELGDRGFCTNCTNTVEVPTDFGEWTRTELLPRHNRTSRP